MSIKTKEQRFNTELPEEMILFIDRKCVMLIVAVV